MGGASRSLSESSAVLRTDRTIYGDATDGEVTFTMPPAADVDDQRFLMLNGGFDGAASKVVVVFNWLDEAIARVGN